MSAIVDIIGREILDSRGNPTVECDVLLESTVRWVGPMLLAMFVVMLLVIAFPQLALWLPHKLGY